MLYILTNIWTYYANKIIKYLVLPPNINSRFLDKQKTAVDFIDLNAAYNILLGLLKISKSLNTAINDLFSRIKYNALALSSYIMCVHVWFSLNQIAMNLYLIILPI